MKLKNLPPNTYHEWLSCFEYMKNNRFDRDYVEVLMLGTLKNYSQISCMFENQLVSLLNTVLDKKAKKFIKELNHVLQCSEMSDLVPLFRRFKKDANNCLFFSGLEFLSQDVKSHLEKSAKDQIEDMMKKIIQHLESQAVEHGNRELDDAMYQIKRIKMFK